MKLKSLKWGRGRPRAIAPIGVLLAVLCSDADAQAVAPLAKAASIARAALPANATALPPIAAGTDTDTWHDHTTADPYRALEQVQAPVVQAWLRAQDAATRATLDALPLRAELAQRVAALSAGRGDLIIDIVRMPGERFFYLKRARGAQSFALVMRQGLSGVEQILVDPAEAAARTGVPHAINHFRPSWDGRFVAYGLSAGGSEDATLYVLNVAQRRTVGEPVPRVSGDLVHWLPDGRSLSFNQLAALPDGAPETDTYKNSRVLWLRPGERAAQARPVFGPTVNPTLGLEALDVAELITVPGSAWMVARTTDTTLPQGKLFVAPLKQLGGTVAWRRIAVESDQIIQVALRDSALYLLSRADPKQRRVLRLDLAAGDTLAKAQVVAKAPSDGALEGFQLTRNGLMTEVRNGASVSLRRHGGGDLAGVPVVLPWPGAATLVAAPGQDSDTVQFTFTRWTEPQRLYTLTAAGPVASSMLNEPAPAGWRDIVAEDVEAPAADGAMVPMTLLYRKGLMRDGRRPTLLDGYGAYGFSTTARFRPVNLAWLERGGVLAYANVRGSGARGDTWYLAGFKQTKANTWGDGIACARWLIDQGFASPATLAVTGGSAGGIFAGRAITDAPELFAAAVIHVGVMDAVRDEFTANGATNTSEFGTVTRADEYPALLAMSTYRQIRDGTAYPAIMFTHGINDPRVGVANSAKATARFQQASSSGKPVLLRLDLQAGHGIGATASQIDGLTVDSFAFLLNQMTPRTP